MSTIGHLQPLDPSGKQTYKRPLHSEPARKTERRHAVDVQLQSPPPTHGLGRVYPKTTAGHDRVTLLLTPAKNGGITDGA